jgi:hypothetical protein
MFVLKSVKCKNLSCGSLLVITSYQVEEINFYFCSVGQKDSKSSCQILIPWGLRTKPVQLLKFRINKKQNGRFCEKNDMKTRVNIS